MRDIVAECDCDISEGVQMKDIEAEKAFREMLPCETNRADIHTGNIRKLGVPSGILVERHESQMTKTFLIFPNGGKGIVRYQADMLKLAE